MQQFERLLMMWLTLEDDVSRLEKPAKSEKIESSFHRRQYVRAAAALVEGFTFMMKQSAALLYAEEFSPQELLLLREQEPLLNDNGKVSMRKRFFSTEANIRFTFTAYAKAKKAAFTLDCSQSDWQDFKKLFAIRNRITHPKKDEELSISDEELDCIKRALGFVLKNYSAVHETIQRDMYLREGMPEPLLKKWMSLQKEQVYIAVHAGSLDQAKKELAILWKKFEAELEDYFGQPKSNGKAKS